VFNGRDVFAPAAAHLAAGAPLDRLGTALEPGILVNLELETPKRAGPHPRRGDRR
jgi:S-adenosylmethionine hydrolase